MWACHEETTPTGFIPDPFVWEGKGIYPPTRADAIASNMAFEEINCKDKPFHQTATIRIITEEPIRRINFDLVDSDAYNLGKVFRKVIMDGGILPGSDEAKIIESILGVILGNGSNVLGGVLGGRQDSTIPDEEIERYSLFRLIDLINENERTQQQKVVGGRTFDIRMTTFIPFDHVAPIARREFTYNLLD
ncbi:MAG: hypothetical protein DHS20C09_22460 [marine bacterium B5-7]|nr:MAG: hypothetical protein DHS20C09_22460 [marine bacterium B5-7]